MLSFQLVLLSLVSAIALAQDAPIPTITASSSITSATITPTEGAMEWGIDWNAKPFPTYYPSPPPKDSSIVPAETPAVTLPSNNDDVKDTLASTESNEFKWVAQKVPTIINGHIPTIDISGRYGQVGPAPVTVPEVVVVPTLGEKLLAKARIGGGPQRFRHKINKVPLNRVPLAV